MELPAKFVRTERHGSVGVVTLDRPEKRNALGEEVLTELIAALDGFREDLGTKVVILAATAPTFSAGAETKVKADSSAEEKKKAFSKTKSPFRRLFEQATKTLEDMEQITVAKIDGHAIGAGWGLALACDFRIASERAQFWIPEVDLGVLLGVGTSTRLVRLVGAAKAKEIVLLGRRYVAHTLLTAGALTQVCDAASLDEETSAFVESLVAKPYLPLAQMKSRIDHIARIAAPESASTIETIVDRGE
jgi:enoyl-CoA hydratase/carnithine racemase